MKEMDEDRLLGQHLSGDPPREAFREQVFQDSLTALARTRQRRSVWRRAELAAAAALIVSVAFFGGRLSSPRALPLNVAVAPPAVAEPDVVAVPTELVEWLNAARLFGQLGMEDRMARAVERAGRLLPAETAVADSGTLPVFVAAGSMENREERVPPMGMPGPSPSVQNVNQILAQAFGD